MTTTNAPFIIADSVAQAVEALGNGATVVAGGTDLVVGHRQSRTRLPDQLVAIDRIAELRKIDVTAEGDVRIGALVNHARLMSEQSIVTEYSALADAAALVGSPATRNAGTLGGNVMNASPAMDTGAPLIVLGANVELQSGTGVRLVDPGELWTGPGTTSAAADELLTACVLPARPERSGSAYVRLEYRRSMEIAVVGAASAVTLDDDGNVAELALALTAVGPTILNVDGQSLVGRAFDEALLADVAELARETASPISDLRAGDRYRRHCVGVMASRATEAAQLRATGQAVAVPVNRSMGIGAAGDTQDNGSTQ